MRLRVEARRALDSEGVLVCGLGRDAEGAAWGWIAGANEPVAVGDPLELPPDRLLANPPGLSAPQVLAVLRHWPAWQSTALADLEVGSRVLVVGGGWLSGEVLRMCRLRGCLWRALQGACGEEHPEYRVDQGHAVLPAPPDAAIVLAGGAEGLLFATRSCRDRGTIVVVTDPAATLDFELYPDVHRRGLSLVAFSPLHPHPRQRSAWPVAATRLWRLRAQGVLPDA